DQEIVLVRNDYYRGPRPALERVVYRIIPDGGEVQALAAYEAGELDMFPPELLLPRDVVGRLRAGSQGKSELQEVSGSGPFFVIANHRQPVLANKRLRLALGVALDRQELVRDALQSNYAPASSLQPRGIVGRRPELWPQENVARAQQLLADAGYPDGED